MIASSSSNPSFRYFQLLSVSFLIILSASLEISARGKESSGFAEKAFFPEAAA
jgi:hypothetical protein